METNIDLAKTTLAKYKSGAIKGVRGYTMQVYKFLTTAYLYNHGVDVANPDLLGVNNRNTQQNNWKAYIEKIKEQVRIDLREIGFVVWTDSILAEYVYKAANRKTLSKDNNFTEEWERATDDAIDYGSGFIKIWKDEKGVLRIKALDPFAFVWNIYNFTKGKKMHQIKTTVTEMMKRKDYDVLAKEKIFNEVDADDHDEELILWQVATPSKKGKGYDIEIMSLEYDVSLYSYENLEDLAYIKIDTKKRRGFADTLGVGAIEISFNSIIKDKVARERLDKVQELASVLMYQKVASKNDKIAGKSIQKFKSGTIFALNSPDEMLQPVNTAGGEQINVLMSEIGELGQDIQKELQIPDVLNGEAKELVNSSGVAINYLQEFASSVHKDTKKRFARQLEQMYKDWIAQEMLNAFKSEDELKKHLSKTDYNYVLSKAVDFLLVQEQIDQYIKGNTEYNPEVDRERFQREVNNKGLTAGGLLETLQSKVSEIQISVSGEKTGTTAKKEFFDKMEERYFANPELFATPFNISMIKKRATLSGVMTEIEVEDFIKTLQNNNQVQNGQQ